jgi:nucleotide-binding universal stress UspA family protein
MEYVARRYARGEVEVELLIILQEADRAAKDSAAVVNRTLAELTELLRKIWSVRSLNTRLVTGRPGEQIARVSQDCQASMVLLAVPHRSRLIQSFFLHRVARRLFNNYGCSVEFIRPKDSMQADPWRVTVPVPIDKVDNFPLEQLQQAGCPEGSRITLLGLLPPLIDKSSIEVNEGAILLAEHRMSGRLAKAQAQLETLAARAREQSGERFHIDSKVTAQSLRDAVAAEASGPDLMLISSDPGRASGLKRSSAAFLPAFPSFSASPVLSVDCSVLLMGPARRAVEPRQGFGAAAQG